MKPVRFTIQQMCDFTCTIVDYAGTSKSTFLQNQLLQDAVHYKLTILGEAARRLPDAFCAAHSELPWQKLRATRNYIIHEYDSSDLELLWNIIQNDLPKLQSQLQQILGTLD